ncbi:MAG TPA: hypothetical protein VF572_07275 [Candidatus Saccharimonadales bacterium]|jgi:hypothetical protein
MRTNVNRELTPPSTTTPEPIYRTDWHDDQLILDWSEPSRTCELTPSDLQESVELPSGDSVQVGEVVAELTQLRSKNLPAAGLMSASPKRRTKKNTQPTDINEPVIFEFNPARIVEAIVRKSGPLTDEVVTGSINSLYDLSYAQPKVSEVKAIAVASMKIAPELSSDTKHKVSTEVKKTSAELLTHTLGIGATWLAVQKAELTRYASDVMAGLETGNPDTIPGKVMLRHEAISNIFEEIEATDSHSLESFQSMRSRVDRVISATE